MSLKQLFAHLQKGAELSGSKNFLGFLRSWEFGKMAQDGNVAHSTMFKGPSGTTVGKDYFGNEYREDNNLQYTRKRWVVYADKFKYDSQSVPAEWHGWLNYINDEVPGTAVQPKNPHYWVPARVPETGVEGKMYQPKGSWMNPQKRSWVKFQTWEPTTAAIANTQAQLRAAAAAPPPTPSS